MRPQTFLLGSSFAAVLSAGASAQQYRLYHLDEGSSAFGRTVSLGLDTEPDLLADIAVGWPLETAGAPEVGRVTVYAGYDGLETWTVDGSAEGDWFGHALAVGDDWDGDGILDLVVGAPEAGTTGGGACSGPGFVRVLSGADGTPIAQITGSQSCGRFGWSVAPAGDVDGDGYREIAVGAPSHGAGGAVFVHSVVTTGPPLASFQAAQANVNLGHAVSSFRDYDGDGVEDFLAGAPRTSPNGSLSGSAFLVSSQTGAQLRAYHGQAAREFFGTSVADIGDVNGDGIADIAVGGPQNYQGFSNGPGLVRIYSGQDGHSLLTTLTGESTGDAFGTSIAHAGDPSGDGRSEIVVGAPGQDVTGAVQVWTVLPDAPWSEVVGTEPGGAFGRSVSGGFDTSRDGQPDFAVGTEAGIAQTYSTTALKMQTDRHKISLSQGGIMTAKIDVGPQYAGKAYYVLGSATGTFPGTFLINMLVPLNWGPYFCEMIVYPNFPPFGSNLGSINAQGKAQMTLSIGAGAVGPAYQGIHLDHCMIVFSPFDGLPLKLVGELAPLTLVE